MGMEQEVKIRQDIQDAAYSLIQIVDFMKCNCYLLLEKLYELRKQKNKQL